MHVVAMFCHRSLSFSVVNGDKKKKLFDYCLGVGRWVEHVNVRSYRKPTGSPSIFNEHGGEVPSFSLLHLHSTQTLRQPKTVMAIGTWQINSLFSAACV